MQKGDPTGVHLPSPSYWPIWIAFSLPLIGYGIIFNLGFAFVGAVTLLVGIYGFALEPSTDPDAGHGDDHDAHAPDGGHDAAAAELPEGDEAEPVDGAEPVEGEVVEEGAPA